jgi:hypothetical protein
MLTDDVSSLQQFATLYEFFLGDTLVTKMCVIDQYLRLEVPATDVHEKELTARSPHGLDSPWTFGQVPALDKHCPSSIYLVVF